VSREHLGLFDTPPTRREFGFALAFVAMLVAAFIAVLPVRDARLGEIAAFVPVVDAVVTVGELIIATMLFAQAAVFRSRALTLLASGFVFIAILLVMHALTFPGAFAEAGLFGDGTNTTAWVMIFRRVGFPLVVILYALVRRVEAATGPEVERPPAHVLLWVLGAVGLAAGGTLLATVAHGWLPPMFSNRSEAVSFNLTVFNASVIVLTALAMAVLLRHRKSVLDIWLTVALAGWLIQGVLNLFLSARFTLGWYCLFFVVLVSHLFVLLALIGESNRLYARLALSTAARERERGTRLMTMDAVAAAISHEVGQPLAAVSLSASAGLTCLTAAPPNLDLAVKSLRDTVDASRRTFEVIKSIRASFAERSGSLSEFSLNELVLATASLLTHECDAQQISLQLKLDRALPPILANRVQIQRVLINLLTNAIEALGPPARGIRRIAVRSTVPDGDNVLLEISDTGVGLSPQNISQIFDPFFTTKTSGTGLGLSLSRTIVEEHGGRLWASPRDGGGATFHLQLPRNPVRAEAEHLTARLTA